MILCSRSCWLKALSTKTLQVLTSSTQHNGAGGAGGDGKSPTGGGGTGGGSAHAGVEGTGGGTTGTGGGKMEVPGHGGGNEGQGVPERREVALDTHRAVPQAGPEVGRRGAGAAEVPLSTVKNMIRPSHKALLLFIFRVLASPKT